MPVSTTHPVTVYLGYHKTASKWIWNHFLTSYYECVQTNLFNQPLSELIERIAISKGPFILRQRLEDGLMGQEIPDLASRLSTAFPQAKICVGIRSQRSLLASHYGQYVTNGGRLSFSAYLKRVTETKWHYLSVLQPFFDKFDGRVCVYLFEDLQKDPFKLLMELRNFIGLPADGLPDHVVQEVANLPPMNPQRSDLVIDSMLVLNRLLMRQRKNAIIPEIHRPGHDHIFVEMAEYISRKYSAFRGRPLRYRNFDDVGLIDKVYGAENNKLSKLIDRCLANHGYPH
ncbi:MAG: hypothetical protein CMM32_00175 [Rhodospirillaceae bacterium]|nr:hypothetical protein [Rhodospirillaceae bacterium]|tara:strand:+ start:775 stop:1632 length:858 start_codon:yes stop_codon:yes gene_type:complete